MKTAKSKDRGLGVKCDHCPAEATQTAQDVLELEPVRDRAGTLWPAYEPARAWRFGCKDHPVKKSRTITLKEQKRGQ